MRISSFPSAFLLGLALHTTVNANGLEDKKPKERVLEPCTVASGTGSFYDLTSLSIKPAEEGKKPAKNARINNWHAKGYDYKSNFTLNVCAPVVEEVKEAYGIPKDHLKNVSAYYDYDGLTYSLGRQLSNLTIRGKKVVLQYVNGSPCGKKNKDNLNDNDEGDGSGRKSATISFICEKDPLVTTSSASFIGTDPDECAYFFEIRSQAACAGSEPARQGVGPAAVFAIIGIIAVLVYFLGGIFYQRNVAHARGWRQLPNYSMWAGIWNFIKDMFVIATSSCARFLPSRRGYSALSISANGSSRGRTNRAEDENRLIDQLDEEWDD